MKYLSKFLILVVLLGVGSAFATVQVFTVPLEAEEEDESVDDALVNLAKNLAKALPMERNALKMPSEGFNQVMDKAEACLREKIKDDWEKRQSLSPGGPTNNGGNKRLAECVHKAGSEYLMSFAKAFHVKEPICREGFDPTKRPQGDDEDSGNLPTTVKGRSPRQRGGAEPTI